MSLALHYWIGGAYHCSGPSVSEMTYTVSSGTLNSTIPYHVPSFKSLQSGFFCTPYTHTCVATDWSQSWCQRCFVMVVIINYRRLTYEAASLILETLPSQSCYFYVQTVVINIRDCLWLSNFVCDNLEALYSGIDFVGSSRPCSSMLGEFIVVTELSFKLQYTTDWTEARSEPKIEY